MRTALVLVVALAAVLFAAGAAFYYLVYVPPPRFTSARIISIYRGESMATAARKLSRGGVVRSAQAFAIYAEITAQASRLKPGDYAFRGGETVPEVLRHLVDGDFMVVEVTIPEGITAHQIGARLEQAGLGCDSRFDAAAREGAIPRALGLGALGAEGFLFPATYRFSPLADTDQVLAAMLERFYSVLTPQVEQRMFALGLDVRQVVTLASIIEKEAKVPGERPLIASVFYNRLALSMPLQSDPTAQYNYAGEPERAAIAVHQVSAFNTYTIAGLPPGPIANPGLDSIHAALYPAHSDYLYFVARKDGTHIFSRSLQEHERAIDEVRRSNARHSGPSG
ncbi:MAG TPA: endolytic transglycosylase MltG [Candidatus Binataceae bacterium]|nr:endolytic transglycosylase MltG [Candidatus Binataceae bacterium]